jgi:hypothetical protein
VESRLCLKNARAMFSCFWIAATRGKITSNTDEGNGITELISACGYRTIANGVGSYSFTHSLVTGLLESAKMPHFSVLEL